MYCPTCGRTGSIIIATRRTKTGAIRRRRQCYFCKTRYTTLEVHETLFINLKEKVNQLGEWFREEFSLHFKKGRR